MIVENDETEYSGGRRSRTYSINGAYGLVAGVDIGATSIDLAVAEFSCKILMRYSETAFVREGPIKILGRVCSMLEKIIRENGYTPEDVLGIGMGIPGPVDFYSGVVISPPIMPGWDRYPIIQTVSQWFTQANNVVDNDVNPWLRRIACGERHRRRESHFCQNLAPELARVSFALDRFIAAPAVVLVISGIISVSKSDQCALW